MRRTLSALAALALALPSLARAEDRILVSHQGRLLDGNDQPVTTERTITLSLFERESPPSGGGETAVWSDAFIVTPSNGLYSALLGSQKALAASDFAGARYLEIKIGDTRLTPRAPLASAPFAVNALTAQKALDADKLGGVAAADYALKADTYSKTEADGKFATQTALDTLETDLEGVLGGSFFTKTEADERFAAKATTYTKTEVDDGFAAKGAAYTKSEADGKFELKGTAYTKAEADGRYAPKDGALPPGAMVISPDPADEAIAAAGFQQVGAARSESYLQRANTTKYVGIVQNAAVVGSRVFVIGGFGGAAQTTGHTCLNTTMEYDLVAQTWTERLPMPTGAARYGHNVAAHDGKVYVFGGHCNNTNGGANGASLRTDVYDPSANDGNGACDTTKTAPPGTQAYGMTVARPNGKIHIIGGYDYSAATQGPPLTIHRVYDVATDKWSTAASLPGKVAIGASGLLPDGRIIVAGGHGSTTATGTSYANLSTTYIYNPTTNTWSTAAAMPAAIYGMGSAVIAGKFHTFGGYTTGYSSVHYTFDPATNQWRTATAFPSTYRYLITAELPGSALLIGGHYNNGAGTNYYYNSTWEYLAPLYLYSKQ